MKKKLLFSFYFFEIFFFQGLQVVHHKALQRVVVESCCGDLLQKWLEWSSWRRDFQQSTDGYDVSY